jgi:hypothetical protein
VFLHGFPEIWYSWRHQMLAVAAAGYHAIAPDCRGYGLSDQPPEHGDASWDDLVADVLGILDALSIPKVGRPVEHPRKGSGICQFSPWPRAGADSHAAAGVRGGQGLRRHAGVRLRAAAPGPHLRRGVPGHPLQPRARVIRHHARRLLHPALARTSPLHRLAALALQLAFISLM